MVGHGTAEGGLQTRPYEEVADLPDLIRYPRWGAEAGAPNMYNSRPAGPPFMGGGDGGKRHGKLGRTNTTHALLQVSLIIQSMPWRQA